MKNNLEMDLSVNWQSLILVRVTISHGMCTSDRSAETLFFSGENIYVHFHVSLPKD